MLARPLQVVQCTHFILLVEVFIFKKFSFGDQIFHFFLFFVKASHLSEVVIAPLA